MNRKAAIIALVGQDNANEIMKLVGSAQAKYLLTDKGKEAKRISNANYSAKVKTGLAEADIVKTQLETLSTLEPQTLTDLWSHFKSDGYVLNDKPQISRTHYKSLLKELNVEIVNPHIRQGIKYYGPAYMIANR